MVLQARQAFGYFSLITCKFHIQQSNFIRVKVRVLYCQMSHSMNKIRVNFHDSNEIATQSLVNICYFKLLYKLLQLQI